MQPMSPPPPFPEFVDFSFDGSMFPTPPPLPSSADLFSPAETTDLLGFLDNFNDFSWETGDQMIQQPEPPLQQSYTSPRAPYSNPHLNTAPEPSTSGRPRRSTRSTASRAPPQQQQPQPQLRTRRDRHRDVSPRRDRDSQTPSNASETSSHPEQSSQSQSGASSSTSGPAPAAPQAVPRGSKPLLSTPQKRLNHIMSEQKRRNAIRDGYAQLIALLAPAGSAPGLGMPQRGRPKGSGSRGKGQKGKSGVLFRAVEYIKWLEEGRDALRDEVLRVEATAGIRS